MKTHLDEKLQSLGGLVPIGETFIPFHEDEILSLENRLQVTLPEDYKDFLREYGAATFAEYVDFRPTIPLPMPISATGDGHISSFYGSADDPFQPLLKAISSFHGEIPDSVIPIADDSGNKICLAIKGAEAGKVFYWDRNASLDDTDMDGVLHPIAVSFEDFILRLQPAK